MTSWQEQLADEYMRKGKSNTPQAHGKGANLSEATLAKAITLPKEYRSKLEASYAGQLAHRKAIGEIVRWEYEPMRFQLAPNLTYTPDFWLVMPDGTEEFHECKGFRGGKQKDGWVKLKMAAGKYPEFRWFIVESEKGVFRVTPVRGS